ncbi:MAG: hypothetical protein J6T96_16350 [Bacteroidales bacterium]|nr:hypothetical protein [Bacteroidales bacterium]
MRTLTLDKILDYYDFPQIFTADDAVGTRYLCLLFAYDDVNRFQYIGVQISKQRLDTYVAGKLDLRDAYLNPETENAVFLVIVKDQNITAVKQLQPSEITEDMLPEKDYFFDVDNYVDKDDDAIDRYQLDVPTKDRETFSTLISRMGWKVLEMSKSAAAAVF